MGANSNIEWTEATWNPVTGCARVSAGCDHCYAVSVTRRLEGAGKTAVGRGRLRHLGQKYAGLVHNGHFNGVVRCHEDLLEQPLRWRKPRTIFVCSMSDLFHPKVPFEFIYCVYNMICAASRHDFQVLTKRPDRAVEFYRWLARTNRYGERRRQFQFNGEEWPARNLWLGTSCEDQKTADERIPHLLKCPAAVRFISYEPALGPVDMHRALRVAWQCSGCAGYFSGAYQQTCSDCGRSGYWSGSHKFNPPGGQTGSGIDWVIVGGESGPRARPMHPEWVRGPRDQCNAAGVPFFFKQWGAWGPGRCVRLENDRRYHTFVDGQSMQRIGKKQAGRLLDGREWNERPGTELQVTSDE